MGLVLRKAKPVETRSAGTFSCHGLAQGFDDYPDVPRSGAPASHGFQLPLPPVAESSSAPLNRVQPNLIVGLLRHAVRRRIPNDGYATY